jgi:hypothetical protein
MQGLALNKVIVIGPDRLEPTILQTRTGIGAPCGRAIMGTMRSRPSSRLGRWNARWIRLIELNASLSTKELARLRVSLERGRPFGQEEWVKRTASELSLGLTVPLEGRPLKPRNELRPYFFPKPRNQLRPCLFPRPCFFPAVVGDEIDGPMRQGLAPPPACEVTLP